MSLTKAREQKTRQLNEVSQQLLKVQSSKRPPSSHAIG
jgi:hypothetical protein